MTISSALLYVNSTNTIPGTSTADITSGISGSSLTWEYDIGATNAARYFWVELIDDNANSSITPLGVYTTEDNTPPVITARSVSRGTPPTTVLNVTFNVTDNDAVQTIYVLLNDTQDTNPGPALIKTIGDAFPGGTTSHTYTGLTPDTIYYTWIMAKDQAGNETSVDAFGPYPPTRTPQPRPSTRSTSRPARMPSRRVPFSHLNENLYSGFVAGSYDCLGSRILEDHIGYPFPA
eukprot:jgi/Tetstr1/455773/TSEL_042570.t1